VITEGELTTLYGNGLHAPTAMRLIDEIRRLRASLAAVEAERDHARHTIRWLHGRVDAEITRCDEAEARLAAVEALCEEWDVRPATEEVYEFWAGVRAATRGESAR
jgi:hypothetical protein